MVGGGARELRTTVPNLHVPQPCTDRLIRSDRAWTYGMTDNDNARVEVTAELSGMTGVETV